MRDCGECVACCVYLKVGALGKKGFQHCPHLRLTEAVQPDVMQLSSYCGGNCKVYGTDDRPEVCQQYRCLWLDGHGLDKDRPDRSGILADTVHKIVGAIECKQLWEDAAKQSRGRAAIRRMSRSTNKVALVPSFYEVRLERVVGRPV